MTAVQDQRAARTPKASMWRSLRVRNYRLFVTGQLVSLTGTWMQRVAQDWLVLELTNSGTALGVVTALQFGPTALFSMAGGALADRSDKRRLLIAVQAAIATLALTLGLLQITGAVRIWHVMVLAAVLGTLNAIEVPTRQSFVIEMVGEDDLVNAVALNSATFNLARIAGPAVAGVLVAAVGTGWSFIVNAASGAAIITALSAMRTSELHPSPRPTRTKGGQRRALRYVRGEPDLILALTLIFIIGTFGFNFQLTLALMAKQVFHQDASGYGFLSTALAAGATIGALISTRRATRPRASFLLLAAAAFSLAEIVVGLTPYYLATVVLLVVTGATMMILAPAVNTYVQLGLKPTMRGRVMGLYLVCFMGGTVVGGPVIGWTAAEFGPRWGLIGGGLICLVATALLGLWAARDRGLHPRELPRIVWRRDVNDELAA